jgi:hypothetical protein
MMIDGGIATSDLLAQRDRMWPVAIYWRFNAIA